MTRTDRNNPPRARGFTIIETVLAVVVGGLVIMGCVSVFLAANRAERAFSSRFERTNELWTTQLAVRRTFLQLLMEEQTATPAAATTTPAARPRVILQTDLAAPADEFGWRPQRLEVSVARSPVPAIVGSQVGAWLVEADRSNSLDFSGNELSSGAIRGVYELRPAGTRELIMSKLGLAEYDPKLEERMATNPPPGWTLWWRPILSGELADLNAGVPTPPDNQGGSEIIQTRLAGAIMILSGIESLTWQIFKGDQRLLEYAGSTIPDLPAFAEVEIVLNGGRYANWMFEIGWATGEDPANADPDAPADPNNPNDPNNPGGGPGGNQPPGGNRPPPGGNPPPGGDRPPPGGDRPGGRPRPDNSFDIGGRRGRE